jgi:hypothetical protein
MKHVKLFESWEEENLPEAEELMDKGEDMGSEDEEAPAEDTEETETEEEPAEDGASWESLKGDILDRYKNGEMTRDEAISALG